MTPKEEKRIRQLNAELSDTVKIVLFETSHEKNSEIEKFCETLSRLVPRIRVKKEDGDPNGHPMIGIGNGLRYQGIPSGTELEPFLEALASNVSVTKSPPQTLQLRLNRLELPAILTLYVAPQCKFCPQVVRSLLPLPEINNNIKLIIIDGTQFPELMQEHNIQAVPTLLLEDQFRWTGSVELNEIIDLMIDRDPSLLGASSLEMILKDGHAARLARMMLDADKIFTAFYDVLTHQSWSTRLGAMVVMEELVSQRPQLAVRVINPLWERFSEVSEQVKGDILYVFGEIGSPDAVPALESVLNAEHSEDVREAAEEALRKIKNF